MPATMTFIELVWTWIMLLGLVTTLANFAYARNRLAVLKRAGENGVLARIRGGAVTDQLKLAGVFAGFGGFGIFVLLQPQAAGFWDVTPPALLFVGVGLMLLWLSSAIRLRQTGIQRDLERQAR